MVDKATISPARYPDQKAIRKKGPNQLTTGLLDLTAEIARPTLVAVAAEAAAAVAPTPAVTTHIVLQSLGKVIGKDLLGST